MDLLLDFQWISAGHHTGLVLDLCWTFDWTSTDGTSYSNCTAAKGDIETRCRCTLWVPTATLHSDWTSAEPRLDFDWTSAGPLLDFLLDFQWISAGPHTGLVLDLCWTFYWTSTDGTSYSNCTAAKGI